MKIVKFTEEQKNIWDDFISSNGGTFLQSYQWGYFQQKFNRIIWRIGVVDDYDRIIIAGLLVKQELPLGNNYLYLPHGPIFSDNLPLGAFDIFNQEIIKIAKDNLSSFIRYEPICQKSSIMAHEIIKKYQKVTKWSIVHAQIQPPDSLVLSLHQSEEELLMAMRQATRYSIKQAIKAGVVVEKNNSIEAFGEFLKLNLQTANRRGFFDYKNDYYQAMYDSLIKLNFLQVFLAKYEGKVIGSIMAVYFGRSGYYLRANALSDDEFKKLNAPYLLLWEAILEAKRRNLAHFDFWGIAPENTINHAWGGFTQFKKGFRGNEVHYIGAYDCPVSVKYHILRFLGIIQKIFR